MPSQKMLHRFGKLLALLSVIVLMDGHWTALQTIAWVRMIQDDSADGADFSDSVVETLSGTRPCAMCKAIIGGRSQEDDPASADFRFVTIPLAPIAFAPTEIFPPEFQRNQIADASVTPESAGRSLIDPPPRAA